MLVASPFPGAQDSGESSPGQPQLMTLPYLPTPGANSELGIENTPLSQDDDFQNEINTFQGGTEAACNTEKFHHKVIKFTIPRYLILKHSMYNNSKIF